LERRHRLTARLRTLGCVELNDSDGKQILQVLQQPKRLALLTYLVLARPHGFQRRDRILLLFWPDSDEGRGRAALRKATYRLRQALGADVIQGRGDTELGLDPDLLHCDVREFDAAIAERRPADALALYGGDLLDGFHLDGASPDFERWLEDERSRLKKDAAQAAWEVSAEREHAGDMAAAVKLARRAFGLAPPDGQRFRHLLEILDRAGDRAGALQAYERFSSSGVREILELSRRRVRSGATSGDRSAGGPDPFPQRIQCAIRASPGGPARSLPRARTSDAA